VLAAWLFEHLTQHEHREALAGDLLEEYIRRRSDMWYWRHVVAAILADLLNLAGVTYVDSSGVGQLVGALTTARNQSGDFKLLKPSVHVLDLLKTTKLDGVFDIHEDETAAIQTFSRSAGANA